MVHRTQVNKLRYKNTFKGSEYMVNFFRGKERYFELCFHENECCSTAARGNIDRHYIFPGSRKRDHCELIRRKNIVEQFRPVQNFVEKSGK